MLQLLLTLLKADPLYGKSREIEIAKGLYELPTTPKEKLTSNYRKLKWLLKK